MIEVVGVFGSGTSLLCAILEKCGCYFGPSGVVNRGRNPHGIYENVYLWYAHSKHASPVVSEQYTRLAFKTIREGAKRHGLRPACKNPGIICSPRLWPLWFEEAEYVVWLLRPTKDYSKDPQWDQIEGELKPLVFLYQDAMMKLCPCPNQWIVRYETLYNLPGPTIKELCGALDLTFNPEAVALVDRSWPRQKPR